MRLLPHLNIPKQHQQEVGLSLQQFSLRDLTEVLVEEIDLHSTEKADACVCAPVTMWCRNFSIFTKTFTAQMVCLYQSHVGTHTNAPV
jgi:hypothetical protein